MKLHEQRNHKEQALANAESELQALRKYMASNKFRCGDDLDGYINITDVEPYIMAALTSIYHGRDLEDFEAS